MTISQSVFPQHIKQPHAHIDNEHCPLCDQLIPNEKFEEIQNKERERQAAMERRLQEKIAQERAQLEAKSKAAIEQVQKDSAAALLKAKEEMATKEAAAREAAKKETEATLAKQIAETASAKKIADEQLKTLKESQEAILNQRLQEQRDALEKAKLEAVNAEKAKAFAEKLKVEEQLQDVQRKLQQKSAEELGEGAEVDLFEALKAEFPDDQITRVKKGEAGADIVHKVMNNGALCGTIIYDSKNRNAWRNDYVTKLRQDQLAAQADHAILATRVFPSGVNQLHIQDGIILANPARAVALCNMLRKQVIQGHMLRLSNQARDEKTAQLYNFIISDRCAQLLRQMDTVAENMLELDVKEKDSHDKTWKKRGELIRSSQKAQSDFSSEIDRIIGTAQTASGQV